MQTRHRHPIGGVLLGIVLTLVALALIGLAVLYSGVYNVAATSGHGPFVRWLFETGLHTSVEARAPGPEELARLAPADLVAGGKEYKEYCQHCHGGPGVKPAEWASGMLPNPPPLSRAAREWAPGEVFWIVRHGIKFSGMPPFGDHHDPQTIWNIAAFVETLPEVTPEEYKALGGGHSHGGGGHGDESGHGSQGSGSAGGHHSGGGAAGSEVDRG